MKTKIEIKVEEHNKLKNKADLYDEAVFNMRLFKNRSLEYEKEIEELSNSNGLLMNKEIALKNKIQEMKYVTRIMTIFYSLGVILMGTAIVVLALKLN